MDPDKTDLIINLCTHAGMIMEDTSLLAVTMPGRGGADIPAALATLELEIGRMAAMIAAAKALAQI